MISNKSQNRTIVFDTQISHPDIGQMDNQDRQFSPWVKNNRNSRGGLFSLTQRQTYMPKTQTKIKKPSTSNLQFLASLKKQPRLPPPISEQFIRLKKQLQKQSKGYNQRYHNTISHDQNFRIKAERRFQELIRKSIQQKRSMASRLSTTKKVDISLAEQSEVNFRVQPLLKSMKMKDGSPSNNSSPTKQRQHFLRKSNNKFFSSRSRSKQKQGERKQSITSLSNRQDIFKTRQKFYKTLQIKLPSKANLKNRISQLSMYLQSKTKTVNKSPKTKPPNQTFPTKPKVNSSRIFRPTIKKPRQIPHQQDKPTIKCHLFGSGISLKTNNLVIKMQDRSTRLKVKKHNRNFVQGSNQQQERQSHKVFLQ